MFVLRVGVLCWFYVLSVNVGFAGLVFRVVCLCWLSVFVLRVGFPGCLCMWWFSVPVVCVGVLCWCLCWLPVLVLRFGVLCWVSALFVNACFL